MRVGDWKILAELTGPDPKPSADIEPERLQSIKSAELKSFELCNLREDIAESRDLARREPERLRELADKLRGLYREVRDESPHWPAWTSPRQEAHRIREFYRSHGQPGPNRGRPRASADRHADSVPKILSQARGISLEKRNFPEYGRGQRQLLPVSSAQAAAGAENRAD